MHFSHPYANQSSDCSVIAYDSFHPVRFAKDFKTPMLSVGEKDYRVPLNNTLEMWSLL